MAEQTVHAEQTMHAEQQEKKQKKELDPRIAFALMVVMVFCALCIGANKAWTKNRANVTASFSVLQENVQQRVETAYNLLTVAGRYLPAEDEGIVAVKQDLQAMESGINNESAIASVADAGEQFSLDAQALLTQLSNNSAVARDSRDSMYVSMMLPQAVEQCSNASALQAYNAAAESFNDGMHSFSGLLARLTGVDYAPVYIQPSTRDALMAYIQQPVYIQTATYDDEAQ